MLVQERRRCHDHQRDRSDQPGAWVGGTVTVWVTVLVLVLVDTVVLVLVVGGGVVVVVVVVGLSVVVVAVVVSVVVLGSSVCVTVSVPPVGTGATEATDDVGVPLVLDVVDVELDPSPLSETMA
jgi:hypothetical protein